MNRRLHKIIYVIRHRKAFRKTERKLLGRNTFDGYTHDLGKLLMLIFCPFFSLKKISKIHDSKAKHHNAKTKMDYIQKVIDYECARFTKPDKPYTAKEYVDNKTYKDPEVEKQLYITLKFLGLEE